MGRIKVNTVKAVQNAERILNRYFDPMKLNFKDNSLTEKEKDQANA